ncbi:FKBP-type peptidyl-prolyl cis-trans isomerase [Nonomuraea sp. LPB2021202275-12-8]|uniref:FKBP-type peptidyl-prolyl cis-trans isomerase n=1 Tax=Nonomuraea sp. LPB2021202275-12-8 TaxID=3120159 RepID=UPI00300C66D2
MRRHTIALLLAPLLMQAACTGSDAADPALRVGGAFGARPTVDFPDGRPPAGLRIDELAAGRGAALETDDVAIVEYTAHVWDGGDNRLVDSTFTRGAPAAFPVGHLPPGLDRALRGRRVGSRVIAAIPPGDSYGAHPPKGVGPGDELFYVVDILGAHGRGAAVEAAGGSLAGVRVTGAARPRLSVPRTAAPPRFAAKVLSRGSGRETEAGRLLVVQYEGVIWNGRRVFDSTWSSGRPEAFKIGDGSVIRGWDRALLGVPVGSRVLMIVPPADGYGTSGHPPSGVRPGDTLVFVVDILAAY